MIGVQFYAATWQMEYKTVAEKVGVSKQTFQDWIKGRSKIPQQRLEMLSELLESRSFISSDGLIETYSKPIDGIK